VELSVTVVDDPGDELRSLRNWLADDPSVRRYGRFRESHQPAGPDAMGTLELLSVVIGSGLSLTQLLNLIVSWRASRPRPVLVRVQAGHRTVEVRTANIEDVPAVVEELEATICGTPESS
jgi:Effector Associated Constant Component 1